MKYYSTKNKAKSYSLREAVLKGLPDDNGLFMPENIPVLSASFLNELTGKDIRTIAYEIASAWFKNDIPDNEVKRIAEESYPFDAPLVKLNDNTFIQELFHGPTLAFKDFGARFMSRLMGWMVKDDNQKLTILVATSGDTGSAVASGFFNVPGIEVIILYPFGKVSPLQEKQLTTWGGNIRALEIEGTFDDCQTMVKEAFLDDELKNKYRLTSANSINISRLVPQCFYYFRAAAQLENTNDKFTFVVPSGNFGNLTAGIFAKKMGLPVSGFVAATNVNDIVPEYLKTSVYNPRPSQSTISNAMDVGNPSNFVRMRDLYNNSFEAMRSEIKGYSFNDLQTRKAMKQVNDQYKYILDPHGAVAYNAWMLHQQKELKGIIMETAHPVKFISSVQEVLGFAPEIPEQLKEIMHKEKHAVKMRASFEHLKEYML